MGKSNSLAGVLSWLGFRHATPTLKTQAMRALIQLMQSQLNREDLLSSAIIRLERVEQLSEHEREEAYITIYLQAEQVILGNEPPVVKTKYTKQDLRTLLRTHIVLDTLPRYVCLLLTEPSRQRTDLYNMILQKMYNAARSTVGDVRCQQYIATAIHDTLLAPLIRFESSRVLIEQRTYELEDGQMQLEWQKVFVSMYDQLTQAIGARLATQTFAQMYATVKKTQDYPLVSYLIEAFPNHISETDRLQYLSRQELEQKVEEAIYKEHARRQELEQRNEQILAYQKELELAKAQVEQKVQARTRELYESHQRLFKFMEGMPIGVVVYDNNKKPYYVNETFKKTLGTDPALLIDTLPIQQAFRGATASSRDIEVESGAKRIPIELSASSVFDADKKVEYVVVTVQDITEERILERSKDEFFTIASHELRTPLTAIRGNAWALKQQYAPKIQDPEFGIMLDDIHTSSVRLIEMVNDFLNMSRLEQGKMSFQKEKFDIKSVVQDVAKQCTIMAQEKNIALLVENMPEPQLEVIADRTKTVEVLMNLVGNAVKFTRVGHVTISLEARDGMARIRVADTGIGIAPENKTLLFRKFQQAGKQIYARDATQGSGLGLYISKLLMEAMGGSIGIETSDSHGSVFFMQLSLAME